jgi:hypothetical protein
MLAKSIIAGTVLSLMAGGVVYFGTDIDTSAVKDKVAQETKTDETTIEDTASNTSTAKEQSEDTAEVSDADVSDKVMAGAEDTHPHKDKTETVETKTDETSVDIQSVKTASGKVIDPKKPIISSSSEIEEKTVKSAEADLAEKPQKKWLDQYLKKDETAMTAEIEPEADIARGSDTGSFVVEEETETLTEDQIEMAEAEGFEERALETENIWVEEESSEKEATHSTRKMLHDIIKKDHHSDETKMESSERDVDVKVMADENGETTIETETINMDDGKVITIIKKMVRTQNSDGEDNKKIRIKVMTDEDGEGGLSKDIVMDEPAEQVMSNDISKNVKIVMAQAEKIQIPELRDRAYLDLVSYGLQNGEFGVASTALTKIGQVELRDTARNRISVAYAKAGKVEEAFNILEDIEVDALRDVMRLQVIEAMIAPEALPEDIQ